MRCLPNNAAIISATNQDAWRCNPADSQNSAIRQEAMRQNPKSIPIAEYKDAAWHIAALLVNLEVLGCNTPAMEEAREWLEEHQRSDSRGS